MRFIHTADWQMGMRAEGLGPAAAKVRDQRLETAKRVIKETEEFAADFLLIAGDLFEHNAIDRVLIRQVVEVLAGFAGSVYILPGNHDPLVPGSVWEHPGWQEKPNLHVLTEPKPVQVPGGTLYPCPLTEKHSMADPTVWIDASNDRGIAIGAAHGTVEGVHQNEPDYPIPRDAASQHSLDYLALGHWHSTATYANGSDVERMAYSGTHEPTKFGERDSGNILKITIDERGAVPHIEIQPVFALTWRVIEHRLENPGDFIALRQTLDDIHAPGAALLDLRLSGLLYADDRSELVRLHELADAHQFLFARIDDSELAPAPDDDGWFADLPPGTIRDVAEQLRQLTQPEHTRDRPEGATPQVASRALMELYSLVQEGQT